jgi:N-acetylglucosaminyl-diphospho-decaprenol L-rhamnosyltransferase
LRRSAIDEIHGFDPAYFMYFEDVDLGDRLGAAGWQNIYAPSARVMHLGGHSTERHPDAMAAAHHRSAYRYLAGRYPRWWQAPLRWALRAGLAGRAALAKRSAQVSGGAALPDRRV